MFGTGMHAAWDAHITFASAHQDRSREWNVSKKNGTSVNSVERKMEPLLIQWKLERRTTSKPRRAGAGGAGSHMETLINNKLASMKFASHDDLY